ncbi:MAG: exodeoxyribonuclease VII small subunit, partial [Pseudomonadales bacterium]
MPKKPASSPASAESPEDGLGELDFETALEELETLVDRMEAGDLTLEASLSAFERGVKLTRHCQSALRDAELKVKKL